MTIALLIILIAGIIYNYHQDKYDPWMLFIGGIMTGLTISLIIDKLPSFETTIVWAYNLFNK